MKSQRSYPPRQALAETYREAARRIAERKNRFSCCAVAGVSDSTMPFGDAFHAYEKLFQPEGTFSFWGNLWDRDDALQTEGAGVTTRQGRRCRVLALCFMAAMVEAGDA